MLKRVTLLIATMAGMCLPSMAYSDVPPEHWAHEAVKKLSEEGILKGYPDGLFRGRHPLSRYELAYSLREMLRRNRQDLNRIAQQLRATQPPPPLLPLQITPEEKAKLSRLPEDTEERLRRIEEAVPLLQRLLEELANDLKLIGEDVRRLREEIGTVEQQIRMLKSQLDRVPALRGRIDLVARGVHSVDGKSAVDLNGYTASGGWTSNAQFTHEMELNLAASMGKGARFQSTLVVGNYMTYLRSASQFGLGISRVAGETDFTLWQADLQVPLTVAGRVGLLKIGRVATRMTPLILWRPDVDVYAHLPRYDQGYYTVDGLEFVVNTDLLSLQLHAGKHDSTGSNRLAEFMRVSAGNDARNLFEPGNPLRQRPNRIAFGIVSGKQSAGAMASVRLGRYLQLGAQWLALDASLPVQTVFGVVDRVNVWGWSVSTEPHERWSIAAAYAQSDLLRGEHNQLNRDNWAFVTRLGYRATEQTSLWLEYREFRPYFAAPGYWGRIGYWHNPVDLAGVEGGLLTHTGRWQAQISSAFLQGTGKAIAPAGLGRDDKVNHWRLGLRWHRDERWQLGLTYEGIFWNLRDNRRFNPSAGLSAPGRPREHYLTLEAQYAFSPNTTLRMLYQLISYDADEVGAFSLLGTNRERGGVGLLQLSTLF